MTGLEWTTNRDAWQALLGPDSNLLQSWAWGEAKAEVEGWRPRRALLVKDGLVVGAVQVLERRFGPLRIARVNRGPLSCHPELAEGSHPATPGQAAPEGIPRQARDDRLLALRRQWRWWTGGALLIAPELPVGSEAMLAGMGFRPRNGPPWRSARVDLWRDEAEMRKALNGKWRNMLVNAEKAGLVVSVTEGTAGVDWLLPRYRAMMAEKGFAATPPELLAALARHADPDEVLTLVARTPEGEDASAVLVVRHGLAATYLVGWNSEAGRRTRANHLLLWRALLEAKDRGIRSLDLGGIDANLTPGVAAFKRGLNGAEYQLAGEWLSL